MGLIGHTNSKLTSRVGPLWCYIYHEKVQIYDIKIFYWHN